jgi:hypothetical protein
MQDIKDEAYKRGQEAIFQEDSTAKAMFNDAFRLRNDPKTGEPTPVSVGVHTAAKTAIPVAGVPANFFNRLAETVYGFPLGAGRILFSRGTKNMTPEQVASCVRQMKRGSVMASAFIIGLCNPSNFGGFYQPGQRKDEDVGFDKIRLWGWDVPRAFTQLPIFQAMQFGATITRLYNYFHDKGKDDTESAFHAIVQAGLGGAEKVPFVGEMMHTETLKNNPAGWFWQKVLGVVNPQAVQQPAKWFDQDAQGETIRRKAEDAFWNPTQNAELGLPGLRKNVPVNTGRDTLDFVKAYNDAGAAQRRAMLPELRHKIDEMRLGKMEADKAWGAQGNRPTGKKHFVGHTKDDIDAVNKALRQGPPELRGLRANYYTPAPDDEDTEP